MKLKLFLLVLGIQTAWLLGNSLNQERALRAHNLVMLETQPVDPRDLLRGDYIVLNYKISDVPLTSFSPPLVGTLPADTTVFVAVASGPAGLFQITRASTVRFSPAAQEIVLQGKTISGWWNSSQSVHVAYGIERFYVAEGTGRPHSALTVQAAVSSSGHATIKQVFLNGKPYADAMKASAE